MVADEEEMIVVGVDGTETSKEVIAWAKKQAEKTKAKIRIIMIIREPIYATYVPTARMAVSPPSVTDSMHVLQRIVNEVYGADSLEKIEYVVKRGNPVKLLVEESRVADLLVLGTHRSTEVPELGSVSRQLASGSYCPLVLVRPDTPINREERFSISDYAFFRAGHA